jgi:TPR repeat protein
MDSIDFSARIEHAQRLGTLPKKSDRPTFANSYRLDNQELEEAIRRAQAGDAEAAFAITKFYRHTVRDPQEAVAWEEIAARLGHAVAQYNRASDCLEKAEYALAMEWAEKSLANGCADAADLIREAKAGPASNESGND